MDLIETQATEGSAFTQLEVKPDFCSATRCTIFNGLYLANLNAVSEKVISMPTSRSGILFVVATDSY